MFHSSGIIFSNEAVCEFLSFLQQYRKPERAVFPSLILIIQKTLWAIMIVHLPMVMDLEA